MSERTSKERAEFAMATERAERLFQLNLCPSGLRDAATNDSLLVKIRDTAGAISESLATLQPAVS